MCNTGLKSLLWNAKAITASGIAVAILSGSPARAASGDQIGSAILIENLVTADFARDTRTLQAGDRVRQEELIEVGLDARSEFNLDDDTKLALGPGTRLKLDKFIYDANKASGAIVVNMAKGTMRWITGVAKKPAYVIRVPNASITVRGTIFDLYVTEAGETWLLLHEGGVQVCNDRGQCRIHEESCKLTRVSDSGDVGRPSAWSNIPGARDNMFHRAFPFVVLPPQIDPSPVCSRDGVTRLREASTPPPPAPRVERASLERPSVTEPVRAAKVPKAISKPVRVVADSPGKPVRRKPPTYKEPDPERGAEVGKPPIRIKVVKPPRIRVVEKPKVKYPPHERKRTGDKAAKIGKLLIGAAAIGGAMAIGSRGGHRGPGKMY
jgi:hypothetical protein